MLQYSSVKTFTLKIYRHTDRQRRNQRLRTSWPSSGVRLGSTRNIHTKVPTPNTKECSSKEITAYIRTGPGSGWYAIRKGHTLECRDKGHNRRSTRMERRLRIYKSPQCQVFTIPLQTSSFPGLLGDHKSSLCSHSPSPETWHLECTQLDKMFDQQEHITSKPFDEFLPMRGDKSYQDNKPSEDTMSSSVKKRK